MSLPYSLEPRQAALYVDRATIYRLENGTGSAETYTKAYENVPLLVAPLLSFDTLNSSVQVRSKTASEVGCFHSDQEIEDKWVIYIEPDSLHSADSWYRIVSGAMSLPVRARAQQVYLGSILPLKPGQISA